MVVGNLSVGCWSGSNEWVHSVHRLYEEEHAKKKDGLQRKWNHLDFLCDLIHDFMGWQPDDTELNMDGNDAPISSNTQSSVASFSGRMVSSSASSRWSQGP